LRQRLRDRQESVSENLRDVHTPGKQHKCSPEAQGSSRARIRGAQSSSHTWDATQSYARGSGHVKSPYRRILEKSIHMGSNTKLRQRLGGRQESVSENARVVHTPGKQPQVAPEAQRSSRVRIRGCRSSTYTWEATPSCARGSEIVKNPYQRISELSTHLGSNIRFRQRLRCRRGSVSEELRVVHTPWMQHKVTPEARGTSKVRIGGS
jgi:hypothetical protein